MLLLFFAAAVSPLPDGAWTCTPDDPPPSWAQSAPATFPLMATTPDEPADEWPGNDTPAPGVWPCDSNTSELWASARDTPPSAWPET